MGDNLAEKARRPATNLLMDSLSDSDIPDLELIAPGNNSKRKKLTRKLPNPRVRMPSLDKSSGVPRCFSCMLSLMLLSLTVGLVVLAWFTMDLYKELTLLKQQVQSGSVPTQMKLQPSIAPSAPVKDFEAEINAVKESIDRCCSRSTPAITLPTTLTLSTTTAQNVASPSATLDNNPLITEMQNKIAALDKNLNAFKQLVELQNDTLTVKNDLLAEKMNKAIQQLNNTLIASIDTVEFGLAMNITDLRATCCQPSFVTANPLSTVPQTPTTVSGPSTSTETEKTKSLFPDKDIDSVVEESGERTGGKP